MVSFNVLWAAPDVNPINKKARSVPVLNPVNIYGRVFFFSWFSFLVAFWSWYAFPPLLPDIIAPDIGIDNNAVLNSNVIALAATLIVRLIAGPSCDRFGPRYTFAGCLLLGALPTFLAGTVSSAGGLYALRFFVGILGGSFVPCQVWTTGFYDKNIVGTANSLTAGLGNAGGGITYFAMPAIYTSLVRNQGLSSHVAWRVTFVVPGIIITCAAIALVLSCPDTPTGKWSDRFQAAENNLRTHDVGGAVVAIPGSVTANPNGENRSPASSDIIDEEKKLQKGPVNQFGDHEAHMTEEQMLDTARGEIVQKPSWMDMFRVMFTPATLVLGAAYFCTFGAELSVNSSLGKYYSSHITPKLDLQTSGNNAAIFGLMNAIYRPLGGAVSDFLYKRTGTVWSKKVILHVYVVLTGVLMIIIGQVDSSNKSTLVGLISGPLAFFLEGANGLTYSLVPHVHPHANGIVSGFAGACGNLGGIVFAIVFRYSGTAYGRAIWIIGCIILGMQLLTFWIKPLPKGQIGGR